MSYKVFTRTFWKETKDKGWPNGLEPHLGRKTTLGEYRFAEQAVRACAEYNNAIKGENRLSRKAEFEKI